MSEYLSEPPPEGRAWCPQCEPDLDPAGANVWTELCPRHREDALGQPAPDDPAAAAVTSGMWLSGSAEVNGDQNRKFCDLIHRRRPPTDPAPEA